MQKPNDETSSKKENKKVSTDKQFKDNEVLEGTGDSINNQENNKQSYPYDQPQEKQFNNQPEFIDRNNDSKDKS